MVRLPAVSRLRPGGLFGEAFQSYALSSMSPPRAPSPSVLTQLLPCLYLAGPQGRALAFTVSLSHSLPQNELREVREELKEKMEEIKKVT